jgi:hypothetical protein
LSHNDRAGDLIAGYPDQLSDAELAELRSLAADDPEIEACLDSIHEAEFLASMDEEDVLPLALEGQLSDRAEERLADAVTQANELKAQENADASSDVVPLRHRKESSKWQSWIALAAGLVLAGGTVVLSRYPAPDGPDELPSLETTDGMTMKGAMAAEVSGGLMIRGTEAASWTRGSARPLNQRVRFYAVVPQAAYLALVEVQNANNVVLYPTDSGDWWVDAGTHELQPDGASAEYSAAVPGRATYVLVGSATKLSVPSGGVIASVDALVSGNPGARTLAEVEVVWQAAH